MSVINLANTCGAAVFPDIGRDGTVNGYDRLYASYDEALWAAQAWAERRAREKLPFCPCGKL